MDSKKNFTSIMVHELRSPIDSIKKISDVMRDGDICNDKKKYAEYIQMIYKSSSYALEVINNLLYIAKIESDKLELCVRPSEIEQIIKGCTQFFYTDAESANVSITVSIGKDIPESLEFDPIYIRQVLNNLLSNALKFTSAGGHIAIQALRYKKGERFSEKIKNEQIKWFVDENTDKAFAGCLDCVVIGVTDSGPGISETDIDKLFTKFIQFDDENSQGTKKGIGLGLAVVKGIIEKHGGLVGVSSREREGSTFYFTISI
jgi:signal transduction histidine kinase